MEKIDATYRQHNTDTLTRDELIAFGCTPADIDTAVQDERIQACEPEWLSGRLREQCMHQEVYTLRY